MVVFAVEGSGVIDGGWEFIWAAYGVTWLFFAVYTVTLILRSGNASEPASSKETP